MSTSKRLVSLLMALVLMVGILAVPAMAATPDTADPQTEVIQCPECGRPAQTSFKYVKSGHYKMTLCSENWLSQHRHYEYYIYKQASCYCGYSTGWAYIGTEYRHSDDRWSESAIPNDWI